MNDDDLTAQAMREDDMASFHQALHNMGDTRPLILLLREACDWIDDGLWGRGPSPELRDWYERSRREEPGL